MESTPLIAFDQHAATTVAAVLLPGQRTPALHSLTSDSPTILRFVERVRRAGPVRCCYEAGPCGFELQRALTRRGIACDVIAPALIPRRPGDRIKTDRRDAAQLAILYRAGALTGIHIPTEQEERTRPGRSGMRPGFARKPGRCPRSTRRIARISGPSTKRSPGSGPSNRTSGPSSSSNRCGRASSACGASGGSMI